MNKIIAYVNTEDSTKPITFLNDTNHTYNIGDYIDLVNFRTANTDKLICSGEAVVYNIYNNIITILPTEQLNLTGKTLWK